MYSLDTAFRSVASLPFSSAHYFGTNVHNERAKYDIAALKQGFQIVENFIGCVWAAVPGEVLN